MIHRQQYYTAMLQAFQRSPVAALFGPHQCGKTTLARTFAEQQPEVHYFDLGSPADRQKLQNPELILPSLSGLVVLDEIQFVPELFSILRVVVDRPGCRTHCLVLGSASPLIIKNVSETLAGRVEFIELSGFTLAELPVTESTRLWLRGGFPRSFLAAASRGVKALFEPSLNVTFLNWEFQFQPLPCAASGPCWRICTDRLGTLLSWDAPRGIIRQNGAWLSGYLDRNLHGKTTVTLA